MDRTKFLARVHEAARAGRAFRVHTRDIPPGTGYVGVKTDLCDQFAAEVNAVGGTAVVVDDDAAALDTLRELLRAYSVSSSVLWQHPLLDRLRMPEVLAESGVTVDDYATCSTEADSLHRQRLLQAGIGITSCEWAIAETGTLVMCHRPGRERATSLVPPVHVAIVDEEQILPDLFDVFARLNHRPSGYSLPLELPSNITLITGPSKTGDIELQLTTGVHGPKYWHVVVIRHQGHPPPT